MTLAPDAFVLLLWQRLAKHRQRIVAHDRCNLLGGEVRFQHRFGQESQSARIYHRR